MTIWIKSSPNLLPFSFPCPKCLCWFFSPCLLVSAHPCPHRFHRGFNNLLKNLCTVLSLQCDQPWPNAPRQGRGGRGETNGGVWNESGFVQGESADRFPFKYVSLTGFGRLFPWQQWPIFGLCVSVCVLVYVLLYVCVSRDLLAWHL